MMTDMTEMADACLSLKYKYNNMIDCVRAQRPRLLQDPILSMLLIQLEAIESAFNSRIETLAGDYEDESDPDY